MSAGIEEIPPPDWMVTVNLTMVVHGETHRFVATGQSNGDSTRVADGLIDAMHGDAAKRLRDLREQQDPR